MDKETWNKGKIIQVMGPVVDVAFEDNELPYIKDALEVTCEGKRLVMEVAQHIGDNTVRCIMLAASEGLCRDMEVTATGKGIQVPVGKRHWEGCLTYWANLLTAASRLTASRTGSSTENRRISRSRVLSWRCWKPESR